jgi:hypothetical protein
MTDASSASRDVIYSIALRSAQIIIDEGIEDSELSALFTEASKMALERRNVIDCLLFCEAAIVVGGRSAKEEAAASTNAAQILAKIAQDLTVDDTNAKRVYEVTVAVSHNDPTGETIPGVIQALKLSLDIMFGNGTMSSEKLRQDILSYAGVPLLPETIACMNAKLDEFYV